MNYATSTLGSSKVRNIKKDTMKKYRFRTWLRNWINRSDTGANIPEEGPVVATDRLQSEGMRFQLYKASGGYVIETASYDHVKDRRHTKMYVVTDDKDLGQELGKIVTMEALRA